MASLHGRIAIVTGAGQGVGRGVSVCLARAGAHVVVNDIELRRIRRTVADVEELGGTVFGLQADVTRPEDVDRLIQETLVRFGKIDILVNNAGAVVVKPISEQTEADWDKVLEVNLKGVFLCCQRVADEMIKQEQGAIVNIASIAAFHYTSPHIPYAASKAGVVAMTRDLAYEVARHGVRVNVIAPGPVETPMMAMRRSQEQRDSLARQVPLGRLGQPEDIGNAVVFLCSTRASFITGVTLPVAGGIDLRIAAT